MSETKQVIEYVSKEDVTKLAENINEHLADKIDKSQGTENANKVLGIGSDGAVSPIDARGDWDEASEANPSFIKNKTHYDVTERNIAFEETTLTFTSDDSCCYGPNGLLLKGCNYGESIEIVIDNTLSFTGTVYGAWGTEARPFAVGNQHMYKDESEDTGEQFYYDEGIMVLRVDAQLLSAGEHTVTIYTLIQELKQLDEKFIPDTIARTEDIPEHTWESLPDKPFGEIEGGLVGVYVSDESELSTLVESEAGIGALEEGCTYTIMYTTNSGDVVTEESVATSHEKYGYLYLYLETASAKLRDMNDGTFCVMGSYVDQSVWNVSIYKSDVVKQIDEQFIPSTIARTSDLESHVEESNERLTALEERKPDLSINDETNPNYVANRTHYIGDTITYLEWDGNTEGLETATDTDGNVQFYRIGDYITQEDMVGSDVTTYYNGNDSITRIQTSNDFTDLNENIYAVNDAMVCVNKDSSEWNGITFASSGTYLYINFATSLYYVKSITKTPVVQLDETFIPSTIARTSDLESHVEESNERLTALEESSFYSPYPVLRVGKDLSYNLFPAIIVDVGELVPGTVYRERPEDYSMVSFVVVCDDGTEKYICSHWVYNEIRTTQAQSGSDDELNQWDIIMYINNSRYVIDVLDKSTADNVTFTVAYNTDYLSTSNTSEYSPTSDYNPATKKYVDEAINEVNEKASVQADYSVNDENAVDYIKNRPFYTADPVTVLEWDGNIEGLETAANVDGDVLAYHIGDYVSKEDMLCADIVVLNNGTEIILNVSNMQWFVDLDEYTYTISQLPFLLFVSEDNWEYNGFTFASSGIYVYQYFTTTSLYIKSIIRNPVVKIDEKYLPDNALVGENGSGFFSHVFNYQNQATGSFSTAFGLGNKASSECQFVIGRYNLEDGENIYAYIIGNGTSGSDRSNAHTVDWKGNAWYAGDVISNNEKLISESAIKKPHDFVVLTDASNRFNYIVQMYNGSLISFCKASSIKVTQMPTKVDYMIGDIFDPSGMIIVAVCEDGTEREITNYSYIETITTDTMEITYKEGFDYYITSITLNAPSLETALEDFTYEKNLDATYTLTGWNGTTNCETSTEIIIPDNEIVVL